MGSHAERGINYDQNFGVLSTPEFRAQADFSNSWESLPDTPGVKFITFKLKGVSEQARDGALIKIEPGRRTPVQQVRSYNQIFWEIALQGNPTLLTVSPNGNFTFGSDRAELTRGWTMCWVADPKKEALLLEYEKPAFKDSSLETVPNKALSYNGHKIPASFWEAIHYFDKRAKK